MKQEESHILNWIEEISKKRKELGGHSVCPYAKNSNYKIIYCKAEEIMPIDGFDAIVFVIEDHFSYKELVEWVDHASKIHEKWDFYVDSKSYDSFIQTIQTNNRKYNLIIAQPKEKLRKFRENLAKTDYYSYWSEEYLKEILKNDINLLNS